MFPVAVPPLRERPEDIRILAEHFLQRFSRKHGARILGFSESARQAMMLYRWPGNVRELQNSIERAVILCNGNTIEPWDFPFVGTRTPPPPPAGRWTLCTR